MNVEAPLEAPAPAMPFLVPVSTNVTALPSAPLHQKTVRLGTVETPLLALLKYWSKPAVVATTLLLCYLFTPAARLPAVLALALITVFISRQVFSPFRLLSVTSPHSERYRIPRLMLEWLGVVALLCCLGFALKLEQDFPRQLIWAWFTLTPLALLGGDYWSTRVSAHGSSTGQRYIIIGANEVGVELARRLSETAGTGNFLGFFDFRSLERLPKPAHGQFAGTCQDVTAFVRRHAVKSIYIALPMNNAPRMEELLDQFRDTTASIYFVPDIFAFDLVQARCVEINGIPMLSICDTPFHGMNAVKKRAIDIVLSAVGLLLAAPLMLIIAIAVKLSSSGPVLFKQRRYGLHGEEIRVYKFRSMTVCEDGPVVVQAIRQDGRITAVGRFLRRTSMDELPQLFNVLQGKMSFVGPRPHAVAHNELYRKLISGYMIRHKVRPGMTGWAQVNGLRGETTSVEQMRLRVQHDLEYLRNWSLSLDLQILFKTILLVFRQGNAY